VVLDADQAGARRDPLRLPQLGGREVGAADLAYLARRNRLVESPEGVGERSLGVGPVDW
jgi:hypothetical protein